jgi:hypothetical protein
MNRRRSLHLEYLEDRVTPATKIAAPILPSPQVTHTTETIVVIPPGGGQVMSPMLGVTLGSSGSGGPSGNGGSGGLGTSTGTPVGPGPGS